MAQSETSRSMSLVSEECALLLEALNLELNAVKNQLKQLTQSLNVDVVLPPSHHEFQPSKTLKKFPILKPVSPATTCEDPHCCLPLCAQSNHQYPCQGLQVKDVDIPLPVPTYNDTQHLLSVVDKREEERAKARSRYLTLMKEHINNQLQQFVEREKQMHKRKEKREKREKVARLQRKPSRFRSNGIDDRSYLENLYQSYLYKIIEVEHGMRKCGKLKSITDLKAFWEQMLAPLQTPPVPAAFHHSSTSDLERELDVLQEEGCTNSWAITASTPDKVKHEKPTSVCTSTVPTPLKFTPCKLPDLIPIKEILDDNQEERVLSILTHSNDYKSPNARLRERAQQLYQRAKANEMAMRTLLPGVEIDRPAFTVYEPPSTSPSLASHHSLILPPLSHSSGNNRKTPDPRRTEKDSLYQSLELESKLSTIQRKNSLLRPLSVKMAVSKEGSLPSSAIKAASKPVCVPLTMSELLLTSPVMEPKGKNLMWTNYQLRQSDELC